jgi:hypothetical protein
MAIVLHIICLVTYIYLVTYTYIDIDMSDQI